MFLLDTRVRYIILVVVLALSFLHYLNDPLRNSDALQCLGLQCRQYSLIINLLSFTFLSAMMISMGILNKSIYVPMSHPRFSIDIDTYSDYIKAKKYLEFLN